MNLYTIIQYMILENNFEYQNNRKNYDLKSF